MPNSTIVVLLALFSKTDCAAFGESALKRSLSFPLRLAKWWEMRHNFTAQWQKLQDETEDVLLDLETRSWLYNGSMNFTFPAGLSAEIAGNYTSRQLRGSVEAQPIGSLNIGLPKELPGNRGTLKFNVNDIFLSSNMRWKAFQQEYNYYFDGHFQFAERVFRLTYSRNFGNSKLKEARSRSTGSEAERSRVN